MCQNEHEFMRPHLYPKDHTQLRNALGRRDGLPWKEPATLSTAKCSALKNHIQPTLFILIRSYLGVYMNICEHI